MTADRIATLPAPWLLVLVGLSTAPVLRIGDVQVLELVQVVWLFSAAACFLASGLRTRMPAVWREYGERYFALLALCAAVSALALRLDFYPPGGASWLKAPLMVSAARLIEWALAVVCMLAAAESFRRSPALLRVALDVYISIAAISAAASILSRVLLAGEIYIPLVYGFDDRVRGFFNEGGPYGMFLVSAGVSELLRARLFPPRYRVRTPVLLALFAAAMLLSGSKAGLLAIALLALLGAVASGTRRRVWLLLAAIVVLAATAVFFGEKLVTYGLLYQNLEEAAAYHPDDPNYVMGRVTGSLIVPRMILAHPAAGIGLGNYSLMRNDPEYLQGLPPTDEWDLPGLGLVGVAAEIGVPLALLLFLLFLRPLYGALRRRAPLALTLTAAFQPVALLLGVNLNFFYPWLLAAFALAAERET